MKNKGILYLIPTPLDEEGFHCIPAQVIEQVKPLTHFIVEEFKTARRFLKLCQTNTVLQELKLEQLNEHSKKEDLELLIAPLIEGHDLGLLSEAGCPGVADPGADLVKICHEQGIRVIPLTGPNSIILALMASGFNGQKFCFQGYLPREKPLRSKRIKELELEGRQKGQTQIFIEAPYRNQALLDDLMLTLNPDTRLCVAIQITGPKEWIKSAPVYMWGKLKPHESQIHKQPAIFLFQA